MVFSSNIFLFYFLPIVFTAYFLLDNRFKNIWLLMASLFFYSWGEPYYVCVMLCSIIINYTMGRCIFFFGNKKNKRLMLLIALLCNLGVLFYFKYLNFTVDIFKTVLKCDFSVENIILPIGISFYTFQGLTYVIDVYKGEVEVQKDPIKLGLYIAMFPQLIAGPIVRYKDVEKQLAERKYNTERCFYGIWRFVQGLAKKAILANTLAEVADDIFTQPINELSVAIAWLGIVCYAFQIYFDFSGYSDMAIGLGKILGFDFAENFDYPYISLSITEFWRRWHISLSSFFRDYVYIPLGGNRKGNTYINLFIVFLLTGLWHGASFNFLIWGIWHGFFIILERVNKKNKIIRVKGCSIIKYIYTMFVVLIGWVFFRLDTLSEAIQYIGRMFNIYSGSQISFTVGWYLDKYLLVCLCMAIIISLGGVRKLKKKIRGGAKTSESTILLAQIITLFVLLLTSIIYVMTATYNPFIYFRF